MDAGVSVNWPASAPVPVNGTESVGFDPVELIPRLPVILPPVCGAKETLKVTLCAAARVSGRLIPPKLNPVPLGVIWEIVTPEPPEFVIVWAKEVLLPTATLPKLKLAGLAVSWPAVMPVPDSGTFRFGLDALDMMVIPPATLPEDVGTNVTLKFTL